MAIQERFEYQGIDAVRVGRLRHAVNTSFVLYRIGDTLIDTAPSNQWRFVKQFVQEKPLRQILLTHHHEDHSGNSARLAQLTGLAPQAPERCREYLRAGFSIPWLQYFIWGPSQKAQLAPLSERLRLEDGSEITPVESPGHADDLVCYLVAERGWLFSADMYIARKMKYLRYDEDLPTLMHSLQKLLALDFDTLLCPHRGVVESGKAALKAKYDNLAELTEKAHALAGQGLGVEQITQRLLGPEDLTSRLSGYQFCKRNLVAGCLEVNLSVLHTGLKTVA